jgi:hypothetical protein
MLDPLQLCTEVLDLTGGRMAAHLTVNARAVSEREGSFGLCPPSRPARTTPWPYSMGAGCSTGVTAAAFQPEEQTGDATMPHATASPTVPPLSRTLSDKTKRGWYAMKHKSIIDTEEHYWDRQFSCSAASTKETFASFQQAAPPLPTVAHCLTPPQCSPAPLSAAPPSWGFQCRH